MLNCVAYLSLTYTTTTTTGTTTTVAEGLL